MRELESVSLRLEDAEALIDEVTEIAYDKAVDRRQTMPFANIKQNDPADRIENHLPVVGAPLLFLRVRQFKSKGFQRLFLFRLHLAITVHIVENVSLMDMGLWRRTTISSRSRRN